MKKTIKLKKNGLGSGLSSLLGEENKGFLKLKNNYQMIPIEFISPGPWQPRKIFDEDNIKNLSESIKTQGVIQPVVLKSKRDFPNEYYLIAGERRWRAAQLARIHEIPALIRDDIEDDKIPEYALVENIQRSELQPLEEAEGYLSLINKYKYTQEQVSKAVSKSRSHIANMIRILSLSDLAKKLLAERKLTIGQLRPLIGNPNCDNFLNIIITNKLSSREVENLVKKHNSIKLSVPKVKSVNLLELEKNLSQISGLSVILDFDYLTEKGSVKLNCKNLIEFDYIIKKIKS